DDITEIGIDYLLIDSGRIPEMLFDLDKDSGIWRSVEVLKVLGKENSGGIFALKNIGRPTDLERVVVAVGIGRKLARGLHLHSRGEDIAPEEKVITDESQVANIFRIPNRQALINYREKYDPSEIFTLEMSKDQAERCLSCGLICYKKGHQVCKLM
ncbi:MAG: hypothetical protein KAR14_13725, partial [Candidatus Aminicenantes bacterium]|nr:hypothetical protein [Candidatus Aminicenantes bacterium]